MNSMRKTFKIVLIILAISAGLAMLFSSLNSSLKVLAEESNPDYYTIYTEQNEELCKRSEEVEKGDIYISYDNKRYEIVEVDENSKKCKAQYIEDVKLPDMSMKEVSSMLQAEKRAGLYITHNDESYIPSDGVDSIYGAGGIHDVANAFANALRNEGFIVDLDETLHIPHDNSAYRRSRVTADRLEKEFKPNVLFDIHRDGAPGSLYQTEVGGEPMSKVRIVVGRGNENFDENYQFALEVKALADEWYPGLINDVYLGARSYNQDLNPQALLLEFGSQEVSKEDAIKSTVPMANVINGVLQKRGLTASAGNQAISPNISLTTENGALYLNTIFLTQVIMGAVFLSVLIVAVFYKKLRTLLIVNFKQIKKGVLYRKK